MEKKILINEDGLKYVADVNGWDCIIKDGEEPFEEGVIIVTLWSGHLTQKVSLREMISTETEEAMDYQFRDMIRKFQECLLERQLSDRNKLYESKS